MSYGHVEQLERQQLKFLCEKRRLKGHSTPKTNVA